MSLLDMCRLHYQIIALISCIYIFPSMSTNFPKQILFLPRIHFMSVHTDEKMWQMQFYLHDPIFYSGLCISNIGNCWLNLAIKALITEQYVIECLIITVYANLAKRSVMHILLTCHMIAIGVVFITLWHRISAYRYFCCMLFDPG